MNVPAAVEEALSRVRSTFERKGADYAIDTDWASNFKLSSDVMGVRPVDIVDTLIAVKQSRLAALRANGRTPANESVADTYLDRAVYAIIAYGLLIEEETK